MELDINILVDKRHKDEEYSSYLWINKEKKLVENPKIYSGDRVEIVQLNFLGSRKKSLYSLPINTTCKVLLAKFLMNIVLFLMIL